MVTHAAIGLVLMLMATVWIGTLICVGFCSLVIGLTVVSGKTLLCGTMANQFGERLRHEQ